MDIRFLGHACFELSDGDTRVLIDPFLNGNPKAAVGADDVDPTHIFLTHGHQDHYGDVVDIAKRTNAQCVAIVGAKQAIPCHYNTSPPIEADAQAFKSEVESQTSSEVVVLEPGDTHSV